MLIRHARWIAVAAALAMVGCDGDTDGNKDTGVSSAMDSGPPLDTGVRALCPVVMNTPCTAAIDCGAAESKQSNCVACTEFNNNTCELGYCKTQTVLGPGDPVNFLTQLSAVLLNRVRSFVQIAISAETTGGQQITCDDVINRRVDLTNGCYNVLTNRGKNFRSMGGNQPTITFTRFPSGLDTLFVVYGYEEDVDQQTTAIGVSCAKFDVGAPGQGAQQVDGDMMHLIQ